MALCRCQARGRRHSAVVKRGGAGTLPLSSEGAPALCRCQARGRRMRCRSNGSADATDLQMQRICRCNGSADATDLQMQWICIRRCRQRQRSLDNGRRCQATATAPALVKRGGRLDCFDDDTASRAGNLLQPSLAAMHLYSQVPLSSDNDNACRCQARGPPRCRQHSRFPGRQSATTLTGSLSLPLPLNTVASRAGNLLPADAMDLYSQVPTTTTRA
jgi:hypothetical protein